MAIKPESILTGYPDIFSFESNKKINEQMEKGIAKIKFGNEQATGFFCEIPFPSKENMLPVIMLCNHIYNPEISKNETIEIQIKSESEIKKIDLNNRKFYTNKDYDITIIELKEKDNINYFLELDDLIMDDILKNEDKTCQYKDETVYAIQYPGGKLSVSYGIISDIYEIKKYNFNHLCCTRKGSSGSSILNTNNKLIGIHKAGFEENKGVKKNYNLGTFLNYPIKAFIRKYFPNFQSNTIKKNINIKVHNIKNNKNNMTLKEYCEKYNLDVIDNQHFDLNEKYIGNEGMEDLAKLNLEELIQLNVDNNNLSDINALGTIKCNRLKNLSLNKNDISDINIFANDIFFNLETLSLNNNNISDINILEKANFPKLKELDLSSNIIVDIKVLEKVTFPKLEELNLNKNKISDIEILSKINLESLKFLYLSGNKISNIKVLENFRFNKLKNLNLSQNNISDCKVVAKMKLKGSMRMNLEKNEISDIKPLDGIKFDKLTLILSENPIDTEKNEGLISNLKNNYIDKVIF